jgi:hypothetical protein
MRTRICEDKAAGSLTLDGQVAVQLAPEEWDGKCRKNYCESGSVQHLRQT